MGMENSIQKSAPPTAHIICDRYLSSDGKEITIGGMQSYFTSLSEVLSEEGYRVSIYHKSSKDFVREFNGINVFGFNYTGNNRHLPSFLFDKMRIMANPDTDLIIFGSEMWIVKNKGYKCLAIQHGIPWDIPAHENCNNLIYWIYFLRKAFKAFKNISKANLVKSLVCVDYNYINWYRALVAYPKVNLVCIPNFSKIPDNPQYNLDGKVKIIFARRLWQYRGTRIFGNAIEKILNQYNNVSVTIAGDGPEEEWLKNKLSLYPQVEFIRYDSNQSLDIHKDKNIAVVPTVGSEGTSLSLLEAMASKCAVITTNVGGLTNIILDNFNGLIIPTNDEQALYESIKYLIENPRQSEIIAENGFNTVLTSFSFTKWKKAWKNAIHNL